MKKIKLLIILIAVSTCSFAQTDTAKITHSEFNRQIINHLGTDFEFENIFGARFESSYIYKIKEKIFFGGKVGYMTYGPIYHRFGVGPVVRYFLFEKGVQPFAELDLTLLYTRAEYWNMWINYSKKYAYFGASTKVWVGFQYRLINKHLGFECKYGLGTELFEEFAYKPINNNDYLECKSIGYRFRKESYGQLGLVYSF